MVLRIGFNAFGCNHGRSGIGSYVYSLIRNLAKGAHDVQVFGPQFDKYIYTTGLDPSLYEGVLVEDTEFSENLFIKTGLNQLLLRQNYDAVLFPAGLHSLPLNFAKPSFLVIQELVKNADGIPILSSLTQMGQRSALQKATGIIAASNYIKENLITLGINEKAIQVIYNGIDTDIFYQHTETSPKKPRSFVIRRPYILYASSISDFGKRHIELIRGFDLFKKKTGLPHRLVIAGSEGKVASALHQAVLSSPFVSDIILAGYIERSQLGDFYAESDVCVFPSEVEGVGLPVIEAMACGVPVACAHAGALPEIAGECAVYFNATDPTDIASALEQLATTPHDSTELKRSQLIRQALDWVTRYNWKKTAEQTIAYIAEKLQK